MLYIGMRLYIGMFQNLRRSKIVGPTVSHIYCYIIMYLFFHGSKMSSPPIVLNHCALPPPYTPSLLLTHPPSSLHTLPPPYTPPPSLLTHPHPPSSHIFPPHTLPPHTPSLHTHPSPGFKGHLSHSDVIVIWRRWLII